MNDYRDLPLEVARRAAEAGRAQASSGFLARWASQPARSWWIVGVAALLVVAAVPAWRLVADRSGADAPLSSAPQSGVNETAGVPGSAGSARDGTPVRTPAAQGMIAARAEAEAGGGAAGKEPASTSAGSPAQGHKESAGIPPSTTVAAAGAAGPLPAGATPSVAQAAVAGTVTLQVASYRNRRNAGRALARLQRAAIDGARLQQARVGDKDFWRLRVGPIDAAHAPDVSARIAGLGFERPQPVRGTSLDGAIGSVD